MGVKVEEFLYDYFGVNQLKDALSNIGVPAGKNKKECVDRILEKWTSYNRSWYDLLNFLDTEDLENICEHFLIEYTDWDDEESLMDKIENARVLDFRKTPKKEKRKKSEKTSPSLNFSENNFNIQNKINSDNVTKINSDNVTKINSDNTYHSETRISKYHLIVGIVAVIIAAITLYVITGVEEPSNDLPVITEQDLGNLLKEGKIEEYNQLKREWVGKLDFDGMKLSNMDLTMVDLRHTSLQGAEFDKSNLTTAFFEGADLQKASFRNANLERAGFVEANLKNAFLRGADLEMANLNRADLQNADLYDANLRQASLIKTNLQNADLQHVNFYWANLEDANLDEALLDNADFRESQNLPISLEEVKKRNAIVD
ncbi:MAG: pentapeptide repeat-containing protein [Candidatus Nitrosopumilus sp. bin_7KS]